MFNSSPIEVWEGAGVFMSFGANTGWTHLWFWLAVIACIIPLFITLKTEQHHENHHTFREGDSDSTHGVERK
ncbi:MAG: hypothetical protein KJN95_03980 [Gammaproteobacteria bacterium]|nr:hypothetical protein [Gammaproteobacteria bacterium]MBT8437252.1 hypothetical protein [Gammaproteobacteria bacterium]